MIRHFLFMIALAVLGASWFLPYFTDPPLSWVAGFCYIAYDTFLIFFVAYQMKVFLKKSPSKGSTIGRTLTILIPSHNEGPNILRCLRALSMQTYVAEKIIVIDDGSTDQTESLLQSELEMEEQSNLFRSKKNPRVFVLKKPFGGKAHSLNQALHFVDTDFVMTLDADTFLEPTAVQAMLYGFASSMNLKAAGGVLTPVCRPTLKGLAFQTFQKFEYIRAFLSRQAWENKHSLLLVSGAFAMYDTKTLKAVNGYDSTSLVEDYELIYKIYRHCQENHIPVEVGVIPEARATTECPDSLRQFLKQRQRWFGGFLQTLFRYRLMVGNPRYEWLGKFMLPIKSLDALQPLYGLSALVALFYFIASQGTIPLVIILFLATKLSIDYIYHFYCLFLYNRWQKRQVPWLFWVESFFITLLEPLLFQPIRHLGAALGWITFLQRRKSDWTQTQYHQ